jgi:hypothetical protein
MTAMSEREIHLSIGWGPWPSEPFLEILKRECERRRLRILVCDGSNVRRTVRAVEAGRLRIAFHLDMQADYEDPSDEYARLGYAAKDSGTFIANEPDAAKAAQNKSVLHYLFERNGIPVPYTIVVRNWEPSDFRLTAVERKRLGTPVIVKPARGFGRNGVVKLEKCSSAEIRRARYYDRGDDFLIQRYVEPAWYGHRMGWFRVFYLFGEVTACWWDTVTQHYEPLELSQASEHKLGPLFEIAFHIAESARMDLFSTEIAVAGSGRKKRFLAIDYINDAFDTTLKSLSHCGVPDSVVRHIASRLAEAAAASARGGNPRRTLSLWFVG